MDREAHAALHRVAKGQTPLKDWTELIWYSQTLPYKSFKLTEKVSQGIRMKRKFWWKLMKWILKSVSEITKKDFLEVHSQHETEVSIWIKIVTVVSKGLELFEL